MEAAPLRAADALHLALATEAEARAVVTFDQRLAAAALLAGMDVLPAPVDPAD
jgi:predicted nucleic acid-binding protein